VVLAIDLPSPSLVLATQTMDWMAKSGEMTFFAISMEPMWAQEISDGPPWDQVAFALACSQSLQDATLPMEATSFTVIG